MEERITKLERIAKHLMRAPRGTNVAIITPYPISNAVFGEKVEGPVLRYMFPCDGMITKGMVRLGKKPKLTIFVNVKLFNDSTSESKGFTFDRKTLSVEPKIPVKAGDCLEIDIVTGEEIVTEFWISFLWKPTVKDIEAKSYLLDEIDKVTKEIEDASQNQEEG